MNKYVSFLAASWIYGFVLVSHNAHANEKTQLLMGDNTVTLEGKLPKLAQMAPGFKVVDEHFTPVMLSDF
ncbi:MAG: thiol peroxidase, partial [Shewanella sp.]